jgi:hypothetical protein
VESAYLEIEDGALQMVLVSGGGPGDFGGRLIQLSLA